MYRYQGCIQQLHGLQACCIEKLSEKIFEKELCAEILALKSACFLHVILQQYNTNITKFMESVILCQNSSSIRKTSYSSHS